MRRGLFIVLVALSVLLASAGPAGAHSAFLGSAPEPGARLDRAPAQVKLTFTEPLNERLSTATVVRLGRGGPVRTSSHPAGKRLSVELPSTLPRGVYQVRWHTVSTRDGHALEGTFAFGVRAAVAGGGAHDVQQSPFARYGAIRVVARVLLYASLLVFCGGVLLQALLGGRDGRSWLTVPDPDGVWALRAPGRERTVVMHAGYAAAGAAALSAAADAADAAGGFSARGLTDFLLRADPGLTRLAVVGLLVVTLAVVAAGRRRAAVFPAAAAMLALAVSGHANASAPRALAVLNDWLHLLSAAVWAGGIAVLVLVWLPLLRGAPRSRRHAVARQVLPAFGRIALPAFVVVAVTGAVSAGIELGRVAALWQSDYGRVLMVKVGAVALIAVASFVHAFRLRPRLLAEHEGPRSRSERRHWRLLGLEPLLGVGVVAAVGVLVAFPLPPRQLDAADGAEAAVAAVPACAPCPLPAPQRGELAVAEQAGSNVVAAWVHREGAALVGTVRVYGLSKRPRPGPLRIDGAVQRPCGTGCRRIRVARAPRTLTVTVSERGRPQTARLPVRWEAGRSRQARRLLDRAQAAMRALRSVRETERVASVPGRRATTRYVLQAPDRMTFETDLGVRSVVVGSRQWIRAGGPGYRQLPYGAGLAFSTRTWFTWSTYAQFTYLLGMRREHGREVAVVALMDTGTPAWYRLHIDRRTHRVLHARLVTYAHFSTERFSKANAPVRIQPPTGSDHGP